jgi:hypothetical protein
MPRWRRVDVGGAASDSAWWSVPDIGSLSDLEVALFLAVAVFVVAVIVIPLLLFGLELIILGVLIAVGVVGRSLLGRPWVVEAVPIAGGERTLTWRVSGWRRSARLINEVADALATGLQPNPTEAAQLISHSPQPH